MSARILTDGRAQTRRCRLGFILLLTTMSVLGIQGVMPAADAPASAPATARPERVLLVWSDDPARTQTVTWRTEAPCEGSLGQIALAAPGPDFVPDAKPVQATHRTVTPPGGKPDFYHQVKFEGLSPATQYVYRVGDGQSWSEWNLFTTASDRPEPFRFIYMGDEQYKAYSLLSRVIRSAFARCPDARFIVHAGDLTDAPDDEPMWKEWTDAAGWIYRTVPSIATAGNHDQRKGGDKGLSVFWRAQFPTPRNGPEGLGLDDLCYFIDCQGLRMIVLDGNMLLEEQAAWLDKVLTDPKAPRWTLVLIHQPMFSTGEDRKSDEYQTILMPVVDRHHVDLFLQGHDHTYARSYKLHGGQVVGARDEGTIYCTSVASPKQYPWNPRYERVMARGGHDKQLYQVIAVDEGSLKYQSYTADGELFDSFELKKDASGQSELIEGPGAATRPGATSMPAAIPATARG